MGRLSWMVALTFIDETGELRGEEGRCVGPETKYISYG
jgi:hypothetical protein